MELDVLARTMCCAAAVALVPSIASGQVQSAPEAPVSARTMALGGGGHAIAMSTSSLYVNPAAMSLTRVYHVDSNVLFDPSVNRWSFGGAVVDSTRTVGMGVAYNYSLLDGDSRGHDLRLGLGVQIVEGLTLGLTGRYVDISGPATANGVRGQGWSGFTVDAGIAARPWRWLMLGVTGYSLSNPDTALAPLAIGGGVGVSPVETLHIVADTYWDLLSFASGPRARWSGGVEFLAGHVPLRVGYTYDTVRRDHDVQSITAGLGYLDTMFGAELSMRQEIVGGSQTTLLLNLRYFHRIM